MDAATLEERYLERARAHVEARGARVGLVLPDRSEASPPGARALAGWWVDPARAGDRIVLPNPYDGVEAIACMEASVWSVVRRLAPRLGERIAEAHGSAGYWRMLLAPWLVHVCSALADRRLFCLAANAAAPGAPLAVPMVPAPPATMAESVRRLRTDDGNGGLFAALAPHLGVPTADPVPLDSPKGPGSTKADGMGRLEVARALPRVAVGAALAALPRRRVGLVGLTRLGAGDLVRLEAEVRGLAPLPNPARPGSAPPHTPPPDPVARARVALPEGDDPLERLAGALMPNLLPISLLEGFGEVRRQSRRRYGEAVNVLVGNYSTDEVQNEFLGRCRAAGRRFAFAQHGGMYLQSPVNAQERLEIEPGARFLSWGGAGDGIVPTPNPYLERLRGSHRGGTRITLVEALEPPDAYVLRFAGHPLGNQGYETAHMLAELVTALPAPRRAHLALKRFPNVLGPPSRPAVLEALPYDGPPGGAAARMATSRLAVIPYLDTPFVEAMVIGTPTLGLWNPAHWPLRIELEPLFERLARAGVVHADPGSAAAHIDGVYDDVASWWERGDVVEARGAFVERFAVSGDALSAWADRLRELRCPR